MSVLLYMADNDSSFRLPHDCPPDLDGPVETEEQWRAARWNPPHGQVFEEPDGSASDRPTLERMALMLRTMNARPVLLDGLLNIACEAAIVAAYGAYNRENETQIRLAGQATPEQEAERVRLIGRCHAVEAEIAAAADLTAYEAIRAKIDSGAWANEPTG